MQSQEVTDIIECVTAFNLIFKGDTTMVANELQILMIWKSYIFYSDRHLTLSCREVYKSTTFFQLSKSHKNKNKDSLDVKIVLYDHYNQIDHLVKRLFLQSVYFYFYES